MSTKFSQEDHLQPILAMAAQEALQGAAPDASDASTAADSTSSASVKPDGEWATSQEPLLLSVIGEELDVPIDAIADFELSLYDTQVRLLPT